MGPCSLGIGSKGRRGAASSDEEQFVRVTGALVVVIETGEERLGVGGFF
ncbi:MAG: hypothetical protein ACRD5B_09710 [Nitrososphaeraceae archaeon]